MLPAGRDRRLRSGIGDMGRAVTRGHASCIFFEASSSLRLLFLEGQRQGGGVGPVEVGVWFLGLAHGDVIGASMVGGGPEGRVPWPGGGVMVMISYAGIVV